jgi:hypothetical protein
MIFQFLFFAKIDILPNSSPTFGVDPKYMQNVDGKPMLSHWPPMMVCG